MPPERSLILVGDMNSSPDHAAVPGPLPLPEPFDAGIPTPYQLFVDAGIIDVCEFRAGNQAGFTCYQAEDLFYGRSELYERIDLIFALDEPSRVKKLRLVGAKVSGKTRPAGRGLWPSDHAGVAAELDFREVVAQK